MLAGKTGTVTSAGKMTTIEGKLNRYATATVTMRGVTDLLSGLASCNMSVSLPQLADILTGTIRARDSFAFLHSQHVAIISYLGALSTGLNPQQADCLYVAGALHDIGKIWIPDHVLQKRENLTAEENAWLNKHPEIGADIIRPISTLKEIAEMVLHHHERFDGSGYPHGLQGENISLGARIVGAANGLALHSERCNSSLAGAISAARSDDVSAYDPQVITAIEKVHEKIAEWLKVIE